MTQAIQPPDPVIYPDSITETPQNTQLLQDGDGHPCPDQSMQLDAIRSTQLLQSICIPLPPCNHMWSGALWKGNMMCNAKMQCPVVVERANAVSLLTIVCIRMRATPQFRMLAAPHDPIFGTSM